MSDFHLKADIPPDATPEERRDIMAKGFQTALTHAATDPEMRLRMILGEAYSRLNGVISWLRVELLKEAGPVRELAEKFDRAPDLLTGKIAEKDVAGTQQKLLAAALHPDG